MKHKIQIIDNKTNIPIYGCILPTYEKAKTLEKAIYEILNTEWYSVTYDMIDDVIIEPCEECCHYPCGWEQMCRTRKKFLADPKGWTKEYLENKNGG